MNHTFLKIIFPLILIFIVISLLPFHVIAGSAPQNQPEKPPLTGLIEQTPVQNFEENGIIPASEVVNTSRTMAMTGQYAKAEEICRESLKKSPEQPHISCQLAELLVMTGRSDEALEILADMVNAPAPTIRCLVKYGKLLQLRGRRIEADLYLERAVAIYNSGLVTDGEGIAMAALACWALERFQDANTLFREAVRADPSNLEAQLLWGDLFFEKYNNAEAQRSYSDVLKKDDQYLPALVGMGRTIHGSSAVKLLETALEINESFCPALEALAEIYIENDLFDEAMAKLGKALHTNPESIKALTLLASIFYLQENYGVYENISNEVQRFSPDNGWFYAKIAETCSRKYQFTEAVELARQAIEADPHHWNAFNILGINLLRLGKEEEGNSNLEFAFEKDPFNFWTMNMLKVLDTMDDFETRRIDNFIVRMHPTDANILWPYLKPLLTECWDTLTVKYDHVPQDPILIEVFLDHEDFSVRTSGLPDMGPLVGVCFGNVITLDSPRALSPPGSMNWQEIVWHEFAHVITLQMTRNRIPRWLTEGISVLEEKHGRPEWGRRQNLDLIKAVQEDSFLGMKQLNQGFSNAETLADLGFAYYQSYLVVEYIVEYYGFETLKELIYQFEFPKSMEDIFHAVFDSSLKSFEDGFNSWAKERVRKINVYLPKEESTGPEDSKQARSPLRSSRLMNKEAEAEAMRERIEAQPRDFQAHLKLGVILYEKGEYEDAIIHLTIASDLLPKYGLYPNPRQTLADIYNDQGNEEAMLKELEELVKYQQHAFTPCYELAQAAIEHQDYIKAAYYLERAIAVNPYHLDVHRLLARIALEQADYDTAIREYRLLVFLEVTDPVRTYTDLAEALLGSGKKIEAKQNALIALEVAPTYERAQHILLESIEP